MKQETNTQVTATATPTPDVALSLVPQPSAEELAVAKAKQDELDAKAFADAMAKKTQAIAKFEAAVPFKLEGETVGSKALLRKVTGKGAVSVTVVGKKDAKVMSGGLTGGDLDAWLRMRKDELKGKLSIAAAELSSNNNWSGKEISLNASENVITMKWVKVAPVSVTLSEPTDEQIAKSLGISLDELKAFRAMKAAAAASAKAEELKAKEQAEKQEAALVALEAEARAAGMTEDEIAEIRKDPAAALSDAGK
jgi:hypothetical protein